MGAIDRPLKSSSWGRQLFEQRYLAQLSGLFAAFATVAEIPVSLFWDEECLICVGYYKGVDCSLVTSGLTLREIEANSSMRDGDNQSEVEAGMAVRDFRLEEGYEGYISSFGITGLGAVAMIAYERVPLAGQSRSPDRSSSPSGDLLERQQGGDQMKKQADLEASPCAKLSTPLVNLFGKLVCAAKDICEVGIGVHLLTRSTLHEITLNLAAVSGAADFVLDKSQSGQWLQDEAIVADMIDCVSSVGDSAYLARSLAGNLLEYYSVSQAASNVLEPISINIDLIEEVERLAEVWERIANDRNVEIRRTFKAPAIVRGNPAQIRQMLHNLLSNAVKYSYSTTERGGKRFISISSRPHDPGFREPRISIQISNYGVGILDEERQHLGEPGFRGSLAIREQPTGLGIGVFIAKQIAHRHGGDIKYESRYLHDTERRIRGRMVKSKTYQTVCTLVFPVIRGGQA